MARILVVDDNPNARKLLVCQLECEGHVVIECQDGIEGLKAAEGEHPDLVITDSNMPGMSGIELVARLRKLAQTLDTPVIFHTASGDEREIRAICVTHRVASILTKPCPPKEMMAEIRSALQLQPPESVFEISEKLQARIPEYLASCEGALATIESALAAHDLAIIQAVGHNLKGTGTAYGFLRITQIGGRLESAAMSGDRTEISERLKELAGYLGDLSATGASGVAWMKPGAGDFKSDA